MRNHEPPGTRLEGWKAIARYLGKDPRTALRWVGLGLPVCRVNGRNSSVYAYSDEVETWLRGRPGGGDPDGRGLARPVSAAPSLETGPRHVSPRAVALPEAAAWPGNGAAVPPRDTDDVLSLARAVAGQVLAPGADPLRLARALEAACCSFLEALHAPASSVAPREPARRAADVLAPSRPARAPLRRLGAGPAVSRPRPPVG